VTDAAERAKDRPLRAARGSKGPWSPSSHWWARSPTIFAATLTRAELESLAGHLVGPDAQRLARRSSPLGSSSGGPRTTCCWWAGRAACRWCVSGSAQFFGKEPSKAVHPDEAVAPGRGRAGGTRWIRTDADGVVLVDVLPMSIGVGLPGGRFKKIIERNTKLPPQEGRWASQAPAKPAFDRDPHLPGREREGAGERVPRHVAGSLDCPGGRAGRRSTRSCSRSPPNPSWTVTAKDKKSDRSVVAKLLHQGHSGRGAQSGLADAARDRYPHGPQPNGGRAQLVQAALQRKRKPDPSAGRLRRRPLGRIQSAVDPLSRNGRCADRQAPLAPVRPAHAPERRIQHREPGDGAKMGDLGLPPTSPRPCSACLCLRPHQPR